MRQIKHLAWINWPRMSVLDLLFHLLNFAAPALAVALLVAGAARVLLRRGPALLGWWASVALNSIAGLAVLGAGLAWYGRDGKMATYAALVLAIATTQWIASRAWRG